MRHLFVLGGCVKCFSADGTSYSKRIHALFITTLCISTSYLQQLILILIN